MAESQQETPPRNEGRRINLQKVMAKLEELDPKLVQLAMLQVLVEEQDETIAGLQAELVAATSGTPSAD